MLCKKNENKNNIIIHQLVEWECVLRGLTMNSEGDSFSFPILTHIQPFAIKFLIKKSFHLPLPPLGLPSHLCIHVMISNY